MERDIIKVQASLPQETEEEAHEEYDLGRFDLEQPAEARAASLKGA